MKKQIFINSIGIGFTLICLFIALSSCSKNSEVEDISLGNTTLNQLSFGKLDKSTKRHFNNLAKAIALCLNDEETFTHLKDVVKMGWEGDNQYLIKNIPNSKSGKSFKFILKSIGKIRDQDLIDLENSPKNRIIIGDKTLKNIDKFNEKSFLVLIAPEDEKANVIKGFDSKGREITLDASVEPDFPVIVLSNCEICDDLGQIKKGVNIIPENNKKLESRSTRVNGQGEYLYYVHTPDLTLIEKWWNGKPELKFEGAVYNVLYSTTFRAFNFTLVPSRSSSEAGFFPNAYCFNWFFTTSHGQNYFIQSLEDDDQNTTTKFTVGVSATALNLPGPGTGGATASYEIVHTPNDELGGGYLIHALDDEPFYYNSDAYIKFGIENR